MTDLKNERDRLLDLYPQARGEERLRILAQLVVLDEEAGEHEQHKRNSQTDEIENCEYRKKKQK